MKKSLTLLALALGISTSFAQELKSKKEEMMLPEAGDWGLAIDADPFLRYAGNFFGKTTTNAAPTFNFFTNDNTITGRYFTEEYFFCSTATQCHCNLVVQLISIV